MASLLYQTIEQISREKHIELEVIVAAIGEDAMIVAARKYYKTEEDLPRKVQSRLRADRCVRRASLVVEEVTDPKKEFTLGGSQECSIPTRKSAARS